MKVVVKSSGIVLLSFTLSEICGKYSSQVDGIKSNKALLVNDFYIFLKIKEVLWLHLYSHFVIMKQIS